MFRRNSGAAPVATGSPSLARASTPSPISSASHSGQVPLPRSDHQARTKQTARSDHVDGSGIGDDGGAPDDDMDDVALGQQADIAGQVAPPDVDLPPPPTTALAVGSDARVEMDVVPPPTVPYTFHHANPEGWTTALEEAALRARSFSIVAFNRTLNKKDQDIQTQMDFILSGQNALCVFNWQLLARFWAGMMPEGRGRDV